MAVAPAAPARPRPGGGRLFIIVGVIVALAGAGGTILLGGLFGGGGGGGAGATTKLLVAANNLPLRHQIVASDVTPVAIAGIAPALAFTAPKDVVNKVTQVSITKGEVIYADMLASSPDLISGSAVQYLPLPTGYVAMTIPTGEQQGVAGNIAVGSYITMIASGSITIFKTTPAGGAQQTGPPVFVAKTIYTQLHVIALGPALAPAASQNGAGGTAAAGPPTVGITSSLTVAVTQCQAEYLTWFLSNMALKYTLESYHDYLSTTPTAASLNCASVDSAKGVTNTTIDGVFHFTSAGS